MSPTRALRLAPLALAAVSLALPAHAADAPRVSWGKAGVGYEQYRDEIYACAQVGLNSDISGTEQVAALRSATRRMEALDNQAQSIGSAADPVAAAARHASEVAAIRASARPERQVQEIKQLMWSVIQQCMVELGYTQFALTEAQRAEMDELGKAERRVYLHRLASDPAVLEQQKQPLPEG